MAGSLADPRLAAFAGLDEIGEDCFGRLFEATRLADGHQVLVRILEKAADAAAIKCAIEAASPDDFLTEIEVVDETLIVTDTNGYRSLGELNRADKDDTLPVAEFEALGIVGAVLPKLLTAEAAQLTVFNLRPNLLFVKAIAEGRPKEGQPSHILRIAEPYQHALLEAAESLADPYLPHTGKTVADHLMSHSLGCLMHHLAFGEPMGERHRENSSISYLYSHYMFQLTKSSHRERMSLASFERGLRTLKDCEALVVYPTSRVVNLLTARGYYTGEIRYGQMHGRGAFTAHKDLYSGLEVAASEGFYCLDKLHYSGRIVYRSGDRYEGQVQWDAPRGEGTLTRLSGTTLRGEWEGTTLVDSAEAEIIIPEYSSYRGQVAKNQPHGAGVMVYNDGLVYKGEFKHGQRHGSGRMFKRDGQREVYSYDGSWYENEKHGEGEEVNEGLQFKGSYHMGKKHGQGSLTSHAEDGWTYEGEFKQDHFHGLGMLSKSDGEKYNGEFKNGKRHGYGCSEQTDGSVYDGQWENDKPHGEGSMTDPDGNSAAGVWLNGEQVEYD